MKMAFLTGLTGAAELSARDAKPLSGIKHHDSFSGALVNLAAESVSTRTSLPSSSPACGRLCRGASDCKVGLPPAG